MSRGYAVRWLNVAVAICILALMGCEGVLADVCSGKHYFSVGPELYHIDRCREGGTRQAGFMYGLRGRYERLKAFGIYWGADAMAAWGALSGKASSDDQIRSSFRDEGVEGRLGYTLQSQACYKVAVTPFLGGGYFRETNRYCHPKGFKGLQFQIRYPYAALGFLLSIQPTDTITVGVNAKAMAMWHARCYVTGDKECADATLGIGDKVNYRVELPVHYTLCNPEGHWQASVLPFYERRRYGGQENFPSDFFDTRLHLYGVYLALTYRY